MKTPGETMSKNVIRSRDMVHSSMEVVSFLRDVTGFHGIHEDLSCEGMEGLSRILGWVNDELVQAIDMLGNT